MQLNDDKTQLLLKTIVAACVNKKGQAITIIDLTQAQSYTDYLVIVSGQSGRQTSAIGEGIEESVYKTFQRHPIGREGYEQGLWVLVDFGEIVVHLFQEEQRQIFRIEELWPSTPQIDVKSLLTD